MSALGMAKTILHIYTEIWCAKLAVRVVPGGHLKPLESDSSRGCVGDFVPHSLSVKKEVQRAHSVGLVQILHCCALSQKLRVAQNLEVDVGVGAIPPQHLQKITSASWHYGCRRQAGYSDPFKWKTTRLALPSYMMAADPVSLSCMQKLKLHCYGSLKKQ